MPAILSSDGSHTFFSEKYQAHYHSTYGALTESGHVFLDMGLRWKAAQSSSLHILEVGFGTGLNALLSQIEAERQGLKVHYLSLETDPITPEDAAGLNYPELLAHPGAREAFLRLHQCPWEQAQALSAHFTLEKKQVPLQEFSAENQFDVVYFDAFSPQDQPELWEEPIFQKLFHAMKKGGGLVTYCAQGEFRRRLRRAGFEVERLPGAAGKREMTRALKPC